jgi:Protein of unknown function (DUF2934)
MMPVTKWVDEKPSHCRHSVPVLSKSDLSSMDCQPQGDSMSTTPSSTRAKRSRTAGAAATATKRPASGTATVTRSVSAEQRNSMIAESAYLRAEARGFQGGDPVQDWLDGEKEVDALLSRAAD